MKTPKFIVVDLFCGFGGTTLGYVKSKKAIVIACVNHDSKAIKSHWENHPDVEHFNEDITQLYGNVFHGILFMSPQMKRLIRMLDIYKAFYPNAKVVLWASLECTNFSKAKGGKSRDQDSRTLANHLDRYIIPLSPDYVKIENVVEFMAWGPLDEKGKPVSMKNGESYQKWKNHIKSLGYFDDWKELNSANFGAYTSRNRLFGCFAKNGLPIVWPKPTHSKLIDKTDLFTNHLKPWRAVREVLDLHVEGKSIFNRKKPLCDKTLDRIYAGLIKFIAGGKKEFLAKYYSGNPKEMVSDLGLPSSTLRTKDSHALITTKFLSPYYKTSTPSSVNNPCPTVPTKDRFNLVSAEHFLTRDFSGGGQIGSIDNPAGSLMTNPKMNIVNVEPFIMPTHFKNGPMDINSPSNTITADRHHNYIVKPFIINQNSSTDPANDINNPAPTITQRTHYIVNPSYWGHVSDIESPSPVIIARQDKSPLYIVDVDSGAIAIKIDETDTPSMIRIKEFMAMYGICDIKMRMLMVPELLRIQGFPDTYRMVGTQTDAKKFIGNSVVPLVVQKWVDEFTLKLDQVI